MSKNGLNSYIKIKTISIILTVPVAKEPHFLNYYRLIRFYE